MLINIFPKSPQITNIANKIVKSSFLSNSSTSTSYQPLDYQECRRRSLLHLQVLQRMRLILNKF